MNNLKHNAYHVLGLDISASKSEIVRRSKEIKQLLKIDEVPEYDSDWPYFTNFRTESTVKKAVQKLESPKKKIKESFFWFSILDEKDEDALEKMSAKNYEDAIQIWKEGASEDVLKKKNLALVLTLLLYEEKNEQWLEESLRYWKEVVTSNKFWKNFKKLYKLHDEVGTDEEIIDDFKENVTSSIADVYTELSKIHGDKSFVARCSRVLGATGDTTKKNVLDPIYDEIYEIVEDLESMGISDDGVFDKQEEKTLRELIERLQEQLNKLVDVELHEDSKSKRIRDRAAEAIKNVVLDLHNNLGETKKSISLMEIALDVAGNKSKETEIEEEIKVLEEVDEHREILQPIMDLVAEEKYEKALKKIESEREEHEDNSRLQDYYDEQKKTCISALAVRKYQEAEKQLNNQNFQEAKQLYKEAGDMIYENIKLFHFDQDAIDEMIAEIDQVVSRIDLQNLNQLDRYRNQYVSTAQEIFEGYYEQVILIILVDAHIYQGMADFMKDVSKKANILQVIRWVGWSSLAVGLITGSGTFFVIGIVAFIARFIYKQTI